MSSLLLFLLHVAFILACAASLQPFDRAAQLLAYSAAVRLSIVVHGLRLIRRCPLPRSFSGLPHWTQEAGGTTEAFYTFGSFLLLSNPSGSLMLVSQSILAFYHTLSYGRNLGPLGKSFRSLSAKAAGWRENALFAMGFLDIMAFVQLFVQALVGGLGIRGLIQSLIYLNLIKNRSTSKLPETVYYGPVWDAIGQSAVGVAVKRLPFFEVARKWFRSGSMAA